MPPKTVGRIFLPNFAASAAVECFFFVRVLLASLVLRTLN